MDITVFNSTVVNWKLYPGQKQLLGSKNVTCSIKNDLLSRVIHYFKKVISNVQYPGLCDENQTQACDFWCLIIPTTQ